MNPGRGMCTRHDQCDDALLRARIPKTEGLIKAVPMRESNQIRRPGSNGNADGLPIQEPSREIRLGINLLDTGGSFSLQVHIVNTIRQV